MKILHTVESYYPSVGGIQEAVKQISEKIAGQGHEVVVATSMADKRAKKVINDVTIVDFNVTGNQVKGINGDCEAYISFLTNSDFDIITNFAAQQWATDLMLPILDKIKAKKVFVPTGFSGLYIPEYQEYFGNMKALLHKYDMNIFLSNDYRDINFARDCGVNKLIVIPNGASEEEFNNERENNIRRNLNIPENHFLVLHVGSHTGLKGHSDAMSVFINAKIKNATFLLIANTYCKYCSESCRKRKNIFNLSLKSFLDKKKILVTSLSREETVDAYKEADLFLFPSKVECSPIVLFECMASKTPFLTSDVGNAAEIIQWSSAGMILPTIIDSKGYSNIILKESAKILEELYRDKAIREKMKLSGYKAWEERFAWEKIALKYLEVYKQLLIS